MGPKAKWSQKPQGIRVLTRYPQSNIAQLQDLHKELTKVFGRVLI